MGNCCAVCCTNPECDNDDGSRAFLGKDAPEVSAPSDPAASTDYGAVESNTSSSPVSPTAYEPSAFAALTSEQNAGEQNGEKGEGSETSATLERDTDSGHESDTNCKQNAAASPHAPVKKEVIQRVVTPPLTSWDPHRDASEKSKLLEGDDESAGEEETVFGINMVVLGSVKVGKSCLIERMIWGEKYNFEDEKEPTLGIRVSRCGVQIPVSVSRFSCPPINVSIWDIPGRNMAPAQLKTILKDKDAVCLVYDRTNLSSTEELVKVIPDVFKYAPGKALFVIMANKGDEFPHPELGTMTDVLYGIIKKHGIKEYDVSAKTGYGVSNVFFSLVFDTACRKFTETKLREAEALETEV